MSASEFDKDYEDFLEQKRIREAVAAQRTTGDDNCRCLPDTLLAEALAQAERKLEAAE